MSKYLMVGAGGLAGAILRFAIKSIDFLPGEFPWDTLIINLSGSFLLALLLTLSLDKLRISAEIRTGLTVGLLGAFTTFSAICKETVSLALSGRWEIFIVYVALTVVLGLVSTLAGFGLAQRINIQKQGCADLKSESEPE